MGARILPFPHPFRSALAVSSDIDFTDPVRFRETHRFLNTGEETPCGRGVGLDVADTFWCYNANPEAPGQLSYFEGDGDRPKDAATLREAFARGWIDALHAYGDFSLAGGFRRAHAERALSEMRARGLGVSVWINHGDDHNFQNLLAPQAYGDVATKRSAGGKVSRTVEYHADLTVAAGIRFVWAGDLTRVVGQDRRAGAWEHYRSHRAALAGGGGGRAAPWIAWGLDRAGRSHPLAGRVARRAVEFLGYPWERGNDLAWIERLRDGQPVYRFRRYGDFTRDCVEDLAGILTQGFLEALARSGGAAVLFTHLGKSRQARSEVPFPADVAEAFRRLARFQDQGRIWVVRTSRLLRHQVAARRGRARLQDGTLAISFASDPVLADLGSEADLAALQVDVGTDPVRSVRVNGNEIAPDRWREVREGNAGRIEFFSLSLAAAKVLR